MCLPLIVLLFFPLLLGAATPLDECARWVSGEADLTPTQVAEIHRLGTRDYRKAVADRSQKVIDALLAIGDEAALLDFAIANDERYQPLGHPARAYQREFLVKFYRFVGLRALLTTEGRFRSIEIGPTRITIGGTPSSAPISFVWSRAELKAPQVMRPSRMLTFALPRELVLSSEEGTARYFFDREMVAHDLYRFMDTPQIREERALFRQGIILRDSQKLAIRTTENLVRNNPNRNTIRRIYVGPGGSGKTITLVRLVYGVMDYWTPRLSEPSTRGLAIVVTKKTRTLENISREIAMQRLGFPSTPPHSRVRWETESDRRKFPGLSEIASYARSEARAGRSVLLTVPWDYLSKAVLNANGRLSEIRSVLQGLYIDQVDEVADPAYYRAAHDLAYKNPEFLLYGQGDVVVSPLVTHLLAHEEVFGPDGVDLKGSGLTTAQLAVRGFRVETERGAIAPVTTVAGQRVFFWVDPRTFLDGLELPGGEQVIYRGALPPGPKRDQVFYRLTRQFQQVLRTRQGKIRVNESSLAEAYADYLRREGHRHGLQNRVIEPLYSGMPGERSVYDRATDPHHQAPIHWVITLRKGDDSVNASHWDAMIDLTQRMDPEVKLRAISSLARPFPGKADLQIWLVTRDPSLTGDSPDRAGFDILQDELDRKANGQSALLEEPLRRGALPQDEEYVYTPRLPAEAYADQLVRAPGGVPAEHPFAAAPGEDQAGYLIPVFPVGFPPTPPNFRPRLVNVVQTLTSELEPTHYKVIFATLRELGSAVLRAEFYRRWRAHHVSQMEWVIQHLNTIYRSDHNGGQILNPVLANYLRNLPTVEAGTLRVPDLSRQLTQLRQRTWEVLTTLAPILNSVKVTFDLDAYGQDFSLARPESVTMPDTDPLWDAMNIIRVNYDPAMEEWKSPGGFPITQSEGWARLERLAIHGLAPPDIQRADTRRVFREQLTRASALLMSVSLDLRRLNRLGEAANPDHYRFNRERFTTAARILSDLVSSDLYLQQVAEMAPFCGDTEFMHLAWDLPRYLERRYDALVPKFDPANYRALVMQRNDPKGLANDVSQLKKLDSVLQGMIRKMATGTLGPAGAKIPDDLLPIFRQVTRAWLQPQMEDPLAVPRMADRVQSEYLWAKAYAEGRLPAEIMDGFIVHPPDGVTMPRPDLTRIFTLIDQPAHVESLLSSSCYVDAMSDEVLLGLHSLIEDSSPKSRAIAANTMLTADEALPIENFLARFHTYADDDSEDETEPETAPAPAPAPEDVMSDWQAADAFTKRWDALLYYPHLRELIALAHTDVSPWLWHEALDQWMISYGTQVEQLYFELKKLKKSHRPVPPQRFATFYRNQLTAMSTILRRIKTDGNSEDLYKLNMNVHTRPYETPAEIRSALSVAGLEAAERLLVRYLQTLERTTNFYKVNFLALPARHNAVELAAGALDRLIFNASEIPGITRQPDFFVFMKVRAEAALVEVRAEIERRKLSP